MSTRKPRGPALSAFGDKLRRAREAKELTQGQVVAMIHRANLDLSGFTRGQLSNYENGKVDSPDPSVLLYLARRYGVDLEDLVSALAVERDRRASLLPIHSRDGPTVRESRAANGKRTG